VRDAEGLLEEHRFLAHLLSAGAPVPRVFAAASGETAIETSEWTYEVHEAPEGVDLYEDAISSSKTSLYPIDSMGLICCKEKYEFGKSTRDQGR